MQSPRMLSTKELDEIRSHFPILDHEVNGKPLTYLDNAATTQKPTVMLERLEHFYNEENANIHRGVHALSQRATEEYESARQTIATFVGAADKKEIIFTRGATEAVNLVASCMGNSHLKAGDTVLITEMEHHANIVPWQLLRDRMGINLVAVGVHETGQLDMEDFYHKLEQHKPSLVAVVHVSNSLGIVNPIKKIIDAAHKLDIPVLIDGAQSIPHFPINVQELDCDFLVCSGHKIFGPTGIGVLYGKMSLLESFPPYQGGGDMIESVTIEKTIYKGPPERFEAGTPDISGAIALAAVLDFLSGYDRRRLLEHETALLEAATAGVQTIPGLRIIGTGEEKASVLSFVMENAHPHDIASFLDAEGIAIRSGHHCTQPLMIRLGLPGTARASFAFYNSQEDVDRLVNTLKKIQGFFS